MGAVKIAIFDALATFLWVFCSTTIGPTTYIISSSLHAQGVATSFFITTALMAFWLHAFNFITELLGGASFNVTGNASLYSAGLGSDTLFSIAARLPAQAAGAAGGALALVRLAPANYRHLIGGPAVKVGLHEAAVAEGLLTFVISFVVLIIMLRGPRSGLVKSWLLAVAIVGLVEVGANYTGPSMNPANAFGWAYLDDSHNTWEQFYVYWICPFVGAIIAGWAYRLFSPTRPAIKQKKKKAA